MPSEITDLKSLSSSSFFMEDAHFPSETQVGLWKLDGAPDYCASGKSVALSPLKKPSPATCQALNSFTMGDQKVHLDMHAAGANQSLTMYASGRSDVDVQQTSYFGGGDKINVMTAQCENSLFSSSLSELFDRKMRLSSNDALYGHSVDTVASHYKEEEPFESLEEIEAQTIGNLLPNDDDFFSGMTNGLEYAAQPSDGDDMEELDLFSSVGGMDLGDDGSSLVQKISGVSRGVPNGQLEWSKGAHCYGGQPSRTLIVRNINNNVKDSELRALFEQYGDIHTLYTACKDRGFVMITYYDIRAAQNAVKVLRNKPWRHRKLDIHYSIPEDNPSEKDMNHGTLMVFNLDSSVSTDKLIQIFGVFGEIKEICETPHGSHQKFVEFYDLRAAEAALHAMNGNDIAGKQIKVELSYFGGSRQCLGQQFSLKFGHDVYGLITQHKSHLNNSTAGFSGSPAHSTNSSGVMENVGSQSTKRGPSLDLSCNHEISSSVPNKLPSLVGIESVVNQSGILELRHVQNFGAKGTPPFHPHSLPENHAALISGVHHNSPGPMTASINNKPPEIIDKRQLSKVSSNGQPVELNKVFASPGNASCPLPGHRYMWSNSYHSNPSMMWPNSLSMVNGVCTAHSPMRLHGFPRAPSNMMNTVLPINNLHVGSAPTINPSLWDRRYAYAGEFTEASGFHPGSLGSIRISNNSMHSMDFVSHNIFPRIPGSCIDVPIPPKNVHQQRSMIFPGRGLMMPMMNPIDPPNECSRSHRNGGGMQADKKQYELDIDRILRGEDKRTTLMIKNIPNKYTSKMLLATIDERHRGTYDFVYLPIDFKNKCNVGYAFINMTDPSLIIPFYQVFNGKKWEKFNSEKVASLAYARIQGKGALIVHFQNSSLMNEDKRCRPMLFDTEGPNAGDQVPFPMGVNVRTRTGKARTIIHDGNNQESLQNFANEENSSDGETTCVALT